MQNKFDKPKMVKELQGDRLRNIELELSKAHKVPFKDYKQALIAVSNMIDDLVRKIYECDLIGDDGQYHCFRCKKVVYQDERSARLVPGREFYSENDTELMCIACYKQWRSNFY
jgi:hypothetical protein